MSFEHTQYARTLFCKQIPDIINALNRIADILEYQSNDSQKNKIYICFEENSPSLSVECDILSNMYITSSFEKAKEWFDNAYSNAYNNNYKCIYDDDLSSFYDSFANKKDSHITVYREGYENNPLYYTLNIRVVED